MIETRAGTGLFSGLGGMAKGRPILATLVLTLGMFTLAVPGSTNFAGEFAILAGVFDRGWGYAAVGAAAIVLTKESTAKEKGLKPVARIVATAAHAREPAEFTIAPVGAIEKLLKKAGWEVGDVDLWEVNEAFACVAMFAMRDIGIPRDKINVHGGATALGHPIGASGTRILVTLINALKQKGLKRGVASLCIGGGEATAVAVELV